MTSLSKASRTPFMRHRTGFDWLGGGLSFLCLCHCLLLPSLLAVFSALTPLADESFHLGLLLAILPLSLVTFVSAYQTHRVRRVLWLGGLGCLFLISALFFEDVANGWFEKGFTTLGTVLLISGHTVNLWQRRQNAADGCCPEEAAS